MLAVPIAVGLLTANDATVRQLGRPAVSVEIDVVVVIVGGDSQLFATAGILEEGDVFGRQLTQFGEIEPIEKGNPLEMFPDRDAAAPNPGDDVEQPSAAILAGRRQTSFPRERCGGSKSVAGSHACPSKET